ncbi:MAG: hypothetical protein PVH88_13280 [Ignavibacteria bacterium]|jgi:hypothetical protein
MKMNISKIFFLFFFVCLVYSTNIYSQDLPKPGTENWKKLPIELRREACNIPETELAQLTTKELLQKCLDYQFMSDILFTYKFRGGLDAIAEVFNGLRELFKRNDAAVTIFDYYSKFNPEQIEAIESSSERGKYSFNFVFLELYMTQPVILNQLHGQEEAVIKEVYNKVNKCIGVNKANDKYIYSGLSMNAKGLLVAVLLDNMKDKSLENIEAEYPEYQDVITNLSISELSEGLFNGLMLRASEL